MTKTRFDIIGKSYEASVQKFPEARTDDIWLIKNLKVKPNDKILEFTAGTGYLTVRLAELIPKGELVAQDISPIMLSFNKKKCRKFKNVSFYLEKKENYPRLKNNYFDKAVCLGGFHHIEDQVSVVKTVYNKLKKGGILCVGDFADESPVQEYFDESINVLTSTGHKGLFLSVSRMINIGRWAGFRKIDAIKTKVPFWFKNEDEIGDFYQLVHGLDQKPKETLKDIRRYMGVKRKGNRLFVPMDYVYARYVK